MKKLLAIIFLVLFVGFFSLPGVYAAWSDNITINGSITVDH